MAAPAQLKIEAGPDAGKVVGLEPGLVTGRGEECGLPLQDLHCSRQHARFDRNGAGWTVEDLGSTNGVFVNDVQASGKAPLRHEDRVRVGHTVFRFMAAEAARPAPPPAPIPRKSSEARVVVEPDDSDPDAIRTLAFVVLLVLIAFLGSEVVRLGLKVFSRG